MVLSKVFWTINSVVNSVNGMSLFSGFLFNLWVDSLEGGGKFCL